MTRRRRGGKRVRRVSTRVCDETMQDLQLLADAQDRKVSDLTRILLESALDLELAAGAAAAPAACAPKADIRRQRGRR